MVICEEAGFVFVSTPKCATNTIFALLEGPPFNGRRRGPFHRRRIPPKCRHLWAWACVRNPYSRAVSIWESTRRDPKHLMEATVGGDSFPLFCQWLARSAGNGYFQNCASGNHLHGHWCGQAEWLKPVYGMIEFVHLETLRSDLSILLDWPDLPDPLPRANTSSDKAWNNGRAMPPWQSYFPAEHPQLREWVQQWAGDDFNRFGYSRVIAIPANLPA